MIKELLKFKKTEIKRNEHKVQEKSNRRNNGKSNERKKDKFFLKVWIKKKWCLNGKRITKNEAWMKKKKKVKRAIEFEWVNVISRDEAVTYHPGHVICGGLLV